MSQSYIPMFAVGKYEAVVRAVENGTLTYPSYIFCTDDNTLLFVDKNSNIQHIKGYQQENVKVVDQLPEQDIRNDVFYICNGVGYLYIDGNFVSLFNQSGETITSYDSLTNKPIINKYGNINSPIILFNLDNGVYMINGQYKLSNNYETIFAASQKILFLINSDEVNKYITKILGNKISIYTINLESEQIIEENYATEEWVAKQGYATESYVTQAINDLYNEISEKILITKVSQLENDVGYLTANDISKISNDFITNLF